MLLILLEVPLQHCNTTIVHLHIGVHLSFIQTFEDILVDEFLCHCSGSEGLMGVDFEKNFNGFEDLNNKSGLADQSKPFQGARENLNDLLVSGYIDNCLMIRHGHYIHHTKQSFFLNVNIVIIS